MQQKIEEIDINELGRYTVGDEENGQEITEIIDSSYSREGNFVFHIMSGENTIYAIYTRDTVLVSYSFPDEDEDKDEGDVIQ